jgi:uncharacterized membrane protein (DUF106 family)
MELIIYLYTLIDNILMPFFRFPNEPLTGYYLGTIVLCLVCVVIGEYSISIAFKLNKDKITRDNREINHFQDLSIRALKAGDKAAYKACNSIANDAFGKSFFSQITLSAASLWPLFIGLGWMQYRFSEVEFTLPFSIFGVQHTFGYFLTFVICYIVTRMVFGRIIKYLYVRSCYV